MNRPTANIPARIIGLAIIAGLAQHSQPMLPTPPAAAQPAFENVAVLVNGYQVFGRYALVDGAQTATVAAELIGPDGVPRARTQTAATMSGGFEIGFTTAGLAPRRPVSIQPGDRVSITVRPAAAEAATLALDVPLLTAEADPATDTLSGLAPPGTRLSLTAYTAEGGRASANVTADAAGHWSADLGGRLDLAPGAYGTVLYSDAEGTILQAAWALPAPAVDIGAASTRIRARPGTVLHGVLTGGAGEPRGTGTAAAWTGTTELWLRDAAGNTTPFLPGDRLMVGIAAEDASGASSLEDPIALDLPPLSAQVDPERNRVTGTADPGSLVRVALDPEGAPALEVAADGRGMWRADFEGRAELVPETRAVVSLPDAPGIRLAAYAPRITQVDPLVAAVSGRGEAGSPVALDVRDAAGRVRGRAAGRVAAEGTFSLAVFPARECIPGGTDSCEPGAPIDLAAGDRLTVTLAGQDQTIAHQPLDLRPDLGNDSIAGRAWPGSRVEVRLEAEGVSRVVQAGEEGAWQADFADIADIRSGSEIALTIRAAEVFASYFSFTAFRASAQTNGDRVRIEGQPGLGAGVEIERGGRVVGSGACTVRRTMCEARVLDPDHRPLPLAADDLVLIYPDGASTASIAVFPMTAHIDVAGADVVGLAPPGQEVAIKFRHDWGAATPIDSLAPTDQTGVYDHELGLSEQGLLLPGLIADVFHTLSDGHRYHAWAIVEVARVTPGSPIVFGLAEPGARVGATLARPAADPAGHPIAVDDAPAAADDTAIASGEATTEGDGNFALVLRDAAGSPVAAVAGDRVKWTFARGPRQVARTIEVGDLAAWPPGPGAGLAGIAPPGMAVQALYPVWAAPGEPGLITVSGSADAGGQFVLADPPVDRARLRRLAWIAGYTPEGDTLLRAVDLTAAAGRVWLPAAFGER